jgi:hypothetical protein
MQRLVFLKPVKNCLSHKHLCRGVLAICPHMTSLEVSDFIISTRNVFDEKNSANFNSTKGKKTCF